MHHIFGGITKMWETGGNLCGAPLKIGDVTTTVRAKVTCKICLTMDEQGEFIKSRRPFARKAAILKKHIETTLNHWAAGNLDKNFNIRPGQKIISQDRGSIEFVRELLGGTR